MQQTTSRRLRLCVSHLYCCRYPVQDVHLGASGADGTEDGWDNQSEPQLRNHGNQGRWSGRRRSHRSAVSSKGRKKWCSLGHIFSFIIWNSIKWAAQVHDIHKTEIALVIKLNQVFSSYSKPTIFWNSDRNMRCWIYSVVFSDIILIKADWHVMRVYFPEFYCIAKVIQVLGHPADSVKSMTL